MKCLDCVSRPGMAFLHYDQGRAGRGGAGQGRAGQGRAGARQGKGSHRSTHAVPVSLP